MRLLILGGTTEASALCRRLAGRPDIDAMLSLAGRTAEPLTAPIPVRIGGFGGTEGLARYLGAERIDALIDATHPFAVQISLNAAEACAMAHVPRLVLTRPPWTPVEGDRWHEVPHMAEAVTALGEAPRTVFLTVGRLALQAFAAAPMHRYLIRTIDLPGGLDSLPDHRLIRARGPFTVEAEAALMREEGVEVLVSKNSGGEAAAAKLVAARRLGLPVVMVRRPMQPAGPVVHEVEAALAWIEAHCAPP